MAGRSTNWFTRAASINGIRMALVMTLMLVTPKLFAQGAGLSGQVVTPFGGPAVSASVLVCPITASGIPCSPLQNLYSDAGLTHQITNPLTTDQYGNYKAFVAVGTYNVQVSLAGASQPTYLYYYTAGTTSSGATLATGAPVFGVTPLTSRPSVQSDIANLWTGSGCGTGTNFLQINGQCAPGGGGGAPPAPPSFAAQFANSGASAFQADTTTVFGGGSAYSYTPGTHTLGLNNLNGIGFISPQQSGAGGNGQLAYFGSKTTTMGVIDNSELGTNGVISVSGTGGSGMTPGTYPLVFTGGGGSGASGTLTVRTPTTYTTYIGATGSGYTSAPAVTAATGGTPPALTANLFVSDAMIPPGTGNAVWDFRTTTGTMGVRGINFVPNQSSQNSNFGLGDSPFFAINVSTTDSNPAPRSDLSLLNEVEGQGYSRGNIGTTANPEMGWTTNGANLNLGALTLQAGIKQVLTQNIASPSPGDVNLIALGAFPCGYATGASDEGCSVYKANVGDMTYGTTTVASVTGGIPTFGTLNRIGFYPVGGMVVDTTLAAVTGTITGTSSNYNTTGVFSMNFGSQGSGQNNSVTYHLTSVANSSGGNAVYQASSTLPGGMTGYVCVQNFDGTVLGGYSNGCYSIVSNTSSSITLNNPHAIAEVNPFAIFITQFPINCSGGGGGTGLIAVGQTGGGMVGTQPTIINPGYGFTSAPTGCVLNSGAGTSATYGASLATPVQSLPIAGTTLSPSNTCITIDYVNAATGPNWQTNVTQTIRCQDQHGSIPTTGEPFGMWIAGAEEPEFVEVFSATAPDANHIQVLSIGSHNPHSAPAMAMQNGSSTFPSNLWFDANATTYDSLPTGYLFFGSDGTGTNALVGFWAKGSLQNRIPLANAEPEQTISPNNGFHGYQGCEIAYTSNSGTVPILNYCNTPFVTSDAITVIPNPAVTIKGIGEALLFSTPSNGGLSQGWSFIAQGVHISTNFLGINPINGNPFNWYRGCGSGADPQHFCYFASPGGALIAPNLVAVVGAWQTFFSGPPPLAAFFAPNDFSFPDYSIFSSQNGSVGNIKALLSLNEIQFTGNIETSQNLKSHQIQFPDVFGGANSISISAADVSPITLFLSKAFFFDNKAQMSGLGFIGPNIYAGGQNSGALVVTGTGGSTVWCYIVTSTTSFGESVGTGPICTSTGTVTPSNSISWSAVTPGASGYNIYRVANGAGCTGCGGTGPAGLLASNPSGSNVSDTGTLINSNLPPTSDSSGKFYAGGPAEFSSTVKLDNISSTTQCLQLVANIITGTGSACGSGSGSSPLTTKGDIYGFNTANARIPVGTNGQVLTADSTNALGVSWQTVTGTGTVTSVAQTVPSWLTVAGSPITGSGTLAITAATGQTAHQVIGTCGTATSFAPCSLVIGDLPAIGFGNLTGNLGTTQGPSSISGLIKDAAGTLTAAISGTDYVIPSGSITGNAGTATALAGTPTLCSTGQAPTGILSSGNATGCASITTAVWSSLLNPTTTLSLSMGNANTTTWTVGSATGSNNMFTWTDTATNSSATGILGHFTTTAGSTLIPWQADVNGIGWKVGTDGSLDGVGSTSTHGLSIPEGNAIAGASAIDQLWADSTAHRLSMNNNNTGATIVAGFSDLAPAFSTLTDGATVTWAVASAPLANASLLFTSHGGSRTLNVTGLVNGGSYVLKLIQDSTGGEGLTLGTGCTWKVSGGGGGAITPSTGANNIDVLAFTYDGTSCYANFNKNFN